jgi:hypothetical protein
MAPITSDLAALAEDRIRQSHERAARRRLAQGSGPRSPHNARAIAAGVPRGLTHLVGRVLVLHALR